MNILKFIKSNFFKLRKFKKIIALTTLVFIVFAVFLLFLSFKYSIKVSDDKKLEPDEEVTVSRNLEGRLLFNDKQTELVYSKEIKDAIYHAQKSIDIAMYSIKYPEIVDMLIQKKDEGLSVNIVVPTSKKNQHDNVFKNTGLNIFTVGKESKDSEDSSSIMHHKFILIDKEEDSRKIIFGSSNLTKTQERYDPSFTLVTSDFDMIEPFIKEFNFLKNNKTGVQKLLINDYKPFNKKINYNNGYMELWFSPGYRNNSIKYRMIDLINQAQSKIEIIAWQINDRDIFQALSKRAKEGLPIIILADDYYLWDEKSIISDLLELQRNINKNIQVVGDSYNSVVIEMGFVDKDDSIISDFNSFLHHHTLIIDGKIVVAGTENWGLNGFYSNDEDTFVTNVDWIVGGYNDYFDFLYKKIKNNDVNFEITEGNNLNLKDVFPAKTKVVLYKEKSHPSIVGEKCFEKEIINNQKNFELPVDCISSKTKLFIIGEKGDLIGSSYIK